MSGAHASRWPWAVACLAIVVSGCGRGGVGATARGIVTIDGQPNVRACVTPVQAGMVVETGGPLDA